MMRRPRFSTWLGALAFVLSGLTWSGARAQPAAPPPAPPAGEPAPGASEEEQAPEAEPAEPVDEATRKGREAYVRGVELSREEQWGDALVAFKQAAASRDAPKVRFAIAYCLRALGRYVAAREMAKRVSKDLTGLAPFQIEDLRAYLVEFEQALVRVEVTLEPAQAKLVVDGRPLQASGDVMLAGIAPPGPGKSPGKSRFTVVLDPGVHLFVASRPGHEDVVLRKSYRRGAKAKLDLRLDVLPATVAVKSQPEQAIVRLDDREVGLAPIEFERPAGRYKLEVVLDDHESYSTELDLAAGQRADLTAKLEPEEPSVLETWWFWTAAAAVIGGGVVITYFATRPEPEPPPYDGGSTGWVVQPQGFHF